MELSIKSDINMYLELLPTLCLEASAASLTTYLITPPIISFLKKNGITGIDVHKIEKPVRAAMGGLGAVIGGTLAIILVSYLLSPNYLIQATAATILLTATVGIYDDLRFLRQRHKTFLLMLAAIPLAWALRNNTQLYIPLLGFINVGYLYPLLLVPAGISGAGNLTNMLAGFNGLETGLGIVALGTITLSAIMLNRFDCVLIALPMTAALCTFLIYNWYPAKTFPGNVGTLVIGSCLACAVIVGQIEVIGIIVMIPHIIDFIMKFLSPRGKGKRFQQRVIYGDTTVSSDGILHPPAYMAFTNVLMSARPMTESRLVETLILLEAIVGLVAIAFTVTVM